MKDDQTTEYTKPRRVMQLHINIYENDTWFLDKMPARWVSPWAKNLLMAQLTGDAIASPGDGLNREDVMELIRAENAALREQLKNVLEDFDATLNELIDEKVSATLSQQTQHQSDPGATDFFQEDGKVPEWMANSRKRLD